MFLNVIGQLQNYSCQWSNGLYTNVKYIQKPRARLEENSLLSAKREIRHTHALGALKFAIRAHNVRIYIFKLTYILFQSLCQINKNY